MMQQDLYELFDYSIITGQFYWKVSPAHSVKVGDVAGHTNDRGYVRIKINGKSYLAHRLAWLYINGHMPKRPLFIDHVNNNPSCNAYHNLRECTNKQNQENMRPKKRGTSAHRGVYWDKQNNKWRAQIKHNRKSIYLGLFDTEQEALQARLVAKQQYHCFNPTQ